MMQQESTIPPKAVASLRRYVKRLDRAAFFYPLDAGDALHNALAAVAKKLASMPELTSATNQSYLISTGRLTILNFFVRKVLPAREAYRSAEKRLTDDDESISLWNIAEALPGEPAWEERRDAARGAINEILDAHERLFGPERNAEISRVVYAYILANGNFASMAARLRMGINRLYAEWPAYLPELRIAAEYEKNTL